MIVSKDSYSFGALLNTFRKRGNFTQQHLAKTIGVHRNAISRWEMGDFLPDSKSKVLELIRALKLDDMEGRQLLEASFTTPTSIWYVPYLRNPFFTGRQATLEHLYQHLKPDKSQTCMRSYALQGLGGIGKTQLAVEYAYCYALEYTAVLWIRADTEENVIASFLHIAESLRLFPGQETSRSRIVAELQRWLTSHSGWLLIWDNLEDMEVLHRYLPPTHQGAILVTTRLQAVGTQVQGIELSPMTREEGILFLLRRAKILGQQAGHDRVQHLAKQRLSEYSTAGELVETMGGLPLALDQVGAYIEETACSVSGYFDLYRKQSKHLLDRRGASAVDHPQSTAATLSLAYACVGQANAAAAELLCLCAFLHPDAILEEIIRVDATLPESTLEVIAHDSYQLDQAIAVLRKYSLINRSSETQTLTIHRLVQVVLKDHMDISTLQRWSERTVRVLNAVFPSVTEQKKTEVWPQCQRYLAHVESCSLLIEKWELTSPEAGKLLHRAGVYLRLRAQYAQAERWLLRALSILQHAQGTEHIEVAETLNALAVLYRTQGKYEEAEPLLQRALTIREILGAEAPDIAETLNELAALYWSWERYKEAEPLFQRALRIWEHEMGSEHPNVARSLNGLALAYWSRGKYREAEPLFQRAARIWEHEMGPEHPNVASSINNLAMTYWSEGRYEDAEPLFQRALQIWEQKLGPEHPEVAIGLNGLGKLYTDQERFEEAESHFLRALEIRKRQLGAERPAVADTLNALAKLYTNQGRFEEAESHFLRALEIRRRQLGAERPAVADTLNGLAKLYADQERFEEAESHFLQALHIRQQQLGSGHLETATILNTLAQLYARQKKYEEAKSFYEQALHIRE